MTNDKFLQTIAALRESSQPQDQEVLAVIDRYQDFKSSRFTLSPITTSSWELDRIGVVAAWTFPSDDTARKVAEIALTELSQGRGSHPLARRFIGQMVGVGSEKPPEKELLALIAEMGLEAAGIAPWLAAYASDYRDFGWTRTPAGTWEPPSSLKAVSGPFESYLTGLDDATLAGVVTTLVLDPTCSSGVRKPSARMLATLAALRPAAMTKWMEAARLGQRGNWQDWEHILQATRTWDEDFRLAVKHLPLDDALRLLIFSVTHGRPEHLELARAAALDPGQTYHDRALSFLAVHFPQDFGPCFLGLMDSGEIGRQASFHRAFIEAARLWESSGQAVFQRLLWLDYQPPYFAGHFQSAFNGLLDESSRAPAAEISAWLAKALVAIQAGGMEAREKSEAVARMWEVLAAFGKGRFPADLLGALGDSSKTVRTLAIQGLLQHPADEVRRMTEPKLAAKRNDERLGAAELLTALADAQAAPALSRALAEEKSEKIRQALHLALAACGGAKAAVETPAAPAFAELEASYLPAAKKLKPPASTWLNAAALPPLHATDGTPLAAVTITYLLAKQSKHKEIAAAPDLLPLLAHLDRATSAPFAAALVEGFLNSEQAAGDRWALALGGLLGDSRVIPPLLARIPGWCDNSRHKLAEYAAQAISLLPGNEPLMVLDTLANRYRSKFKNVGKACAEAFAAAAKARGITPDELGDMVVPDFGFDAEGVRAFTWDGGGASAELGADFKLTWFDPASEKTWKTLPASAPADMQTEVKTLAKLLREAVKAQTPRLETALVRQRRWPVARWRELYGIHPLLRSFASQLVWGIYAASGSLLRTFRRYPNGLLADAAGSLEEIPEAGAQIGIVHPLELSAEALQAWRAHLARFKVKPPFPQIDRPVETLDPLWGNRREVALTKGKKLGAGTFRSRAEKRGWARGSVVDGGAIYSYYKAYPGAGYEAVLRLDFFGIGFDPMEEIELGAAYFVTAGSVERGSYAYDEPAPDDPRVLRFDAIPAVVWSETLSDLKAILGETSSPTP